MRHDPWSLSSIWTLNLCQGHRCWDSHRKSRLLPMWTLIRPYIDRLWAKGSSGPGPDGTGQHDSGKQYRFAQTNSCFHCTRVQSLHCSILPMNCMRRWSTIIGGHHLLLHGLDRRLPVCQPPDRDTRLPRDHLWFPKGSCDFHHKKRHQNKAGWHCYTD